MIPSSVTVVIPAMNVSPVAIVRIVSVVTVA